MRRQRPIEGFTLIEMAMVLVIIGLIVGGVLVGRDLVRAAEVRAQISQIEKYNSAVNTFKGKYGGIPGDLALPSAQQFGFVTTSCIGVAASRDGNGLIDGYTPPSTYGQGKGETLLFWEDLSNPITGNLIGASFPNSGAPAMGCYIAAFSLVPTTIGYYYPDGKLGNGLFVYVYENGVSNWFGLSAVTTVTGMMSSNPTISVAQSYNIDSKVDDGFANAGNVQAIYLNNSTINAVSAPNAPVDTTTTCYNSGNGVYSFTVNNGSGANCALSFKFN